MTLRSGEIAGALTCAAEIEPYVRGCAWASGSGVPYPRANPDPMEVSRLPVDTWGAAGLPAAVRLEFTGAATSLEIGYHASNDNLGIRGDSAGRSFSLWSDKRKLAEVKAVMGASVAKFDLPALAVDERYIVYLPEGMKPLVTRLTAQGGTIQPAPAQPRWIAYGDSITEGWVASEPALGWPMVAGRRFGLDVVNMGYAGAARGETVSAEHVAAASCDAISVAFGTNCWTRIPHSAEQMRANLNAFLEILRQGHPKAPIVVLSPVLRPDAEIKANRLGATLADLRRAIEESTEKRIASGDGLLSLVRGLPLLKASQLPDQIHPGDEGHALLAQVVGKAVRIALERNE